MSGTISICMQQQVDRNGDPLIGGFLYMYAAGTTTPQNGFRDAALVNAYPNPIQLDASARIPSIFFADGVIRIRLTDHSGVLQFDADNLPVIGSSAGGGGVDTTDLNALYNTGDLKCRYGTGTLTGYVRCNARTIGSATSGATERANADCQALFQFLWNNDTALPVTPSRGADAVSDWNANKQIATPDFRGCAIAGLDDMGSSAAGRLTAATIPAPTTLGSAGGVQLVTLDINMIPSHAHSISDVSHRHTFPGANASIVSDSPGGNVGQLSLGTGGGYRQPLTTIPMDLSSAGITGTNANGGSQPHGIVQPTKLITIYIRL